MSADVCPYRSSLIDPRGKPKPHRYTVIVLMPPAVEHRCSGCYRLDPQDRLGVRPDPEANEYPPLLSHETGGGEYGASPPPRAESP